MLLQRNVQEVMFYFVEESCNRILSNICQASLCWRCVRWRSFRTNEAALFVFSLGCQCYFGCVGSKLFLNIVIMVLLTL